MTAAPSGSCLACHHDEHGDGGLPAYGIARPAVSAAGRREGSRAGRPAGNTHGERKYMAPHLARGMAADAYGEARQGARNVAGKAGQALVLDDAIRWLGGCGDMAGTAAAKIVGCRRRRRRRYGGENVPENMSRS